MRFPTACLAELPTTDTSHPIIQRSADFPRGVSPAYDANHLTVDASDPMAHVGLMEEHQQEVGSAGETGSKTLTISRSVPESHGDGKLLE